MKRSEPSKNDYQIWIRTYNQRRDALRKKHGWVRFKPNPAYAKEVVKLTLKLRTWRRQLKIIEQREQELKAIGRIVSEFMGVSIYKSHKQIKRHITLARKIFCKYCIEHGYRGSQVSWYLGYRRADLPTYIRREFTRSFKHNQKHKETWRKFLTYIKSELKDLKKAA